MVPQVILQVMLVFGDEIAPRTRQELLTFDVLFGVVPEFLFTSGHEIALLAFVFTGLTPTPVHCPIGVRRVNALVVVFLSVFSEDPIAGPTLGRVFRMEISYMPFETPFSS